MTEYVFGISSCCHEEKGRSYGGGKEKAVEIFR